MHSVANKEKPGIPLPAMVAAVWGGFLYEGLLASRPNRRRSVEVLELWGQGCIELVIATSLYLPEVWRQITAKWDQEDADFPGVFEYEVVSPLGTYLGDYLLANSGTLPSQDIAKEKLQELIRSFFANGAGAEAAAPASTGVSPMVGNVDQTKPAGMEPLPL